MRPSMPFSWTGFFFGVTPVTAARTTPGNPPNMRRSMSADVMRRASARWILARRIFSLASKATTSVAPSLRLETDIQYTRFLTSYVTTTAAGPSISLTSVRQELEISRTFRPASAARRPRTVHITASCLWRHDNNAEASPAAPARALEQVQAGFRARVGYTSPALEYAVPNTMS